MPYIPPNNRWTRWDLDDLLSHPKDAGELNYLLTLICHEYLDSGEANYSAINEIIGVLECAKLEFYRRIASPYEDKKIKENGDVY